MFDIGLLTVSAVSVLSLFTVSLLVGEEVVIDDIEVTRQLEWNGFTSDVVTRQLTDSLREISVTAGSQVAALKVDETEIEKGIGAFDDYFQLSELINGTRSIFGLIPFHIDGEITETREEALFYARVYTPEQPEPLFEVEVNGDTNDIRQLMHSAALDLLGQMDPYLVAIYHRRLEEAAKEYDFPQTKIFAKRFLETKPVEEHFLIYGLLGRAHMIRAERDSALSSVQQQDEYEAAINYLNAALLQRPDFLFPLVNLGIINAERGDAAAAEKYFAAAVNVDPNYLETRIAWGDLLTKQDRDLDVLYQYVAAVELEPDDAELRDKLARSYLRVGMREAAREQWLSALQISPLTTAYLENARSLDPSEIMPAGENDNCVQSPALAC